MRTKQDNVLNRLFASPQDELDRFLLAKSFQFWLPPRMAKVTGLSIAEVNQRLDAMATRAIG